MLKQRILTALVLTPIFLLLLFFLPPLPFAVFTGLIVLLGAWEWSFFMGINTFPKYLIYPFFIFLILISTLFLSIKLTLYSSCVFWLIALMLVMLYPKLSNVWGRDIPIRALMGVFVLVPAWVALNFIRNSDLGIWRLFFLFVLIWGADTAAYFVGKKWGKTKLAPKVSPGKTWQGLVGALLASLMITLFTLYLFQVPPHFWWGALLLSLVTVLFSILGDLFESMLKRNVDMKDSSHLLPGHGGVLDRIDSLTAAAPVFAVGLIILSIFFN